MSRRGRKNFTLAFPLEDFCEAKSCRGQVFAAKDARSAVASGVPRKPDDG